VVAADQREAHPDLPWLALGERVQRAFQWNAPPGSPQCRVVRNQLLAQPVQPHPPASGPEHAATSPGNSTQKWPIRWGLDRSPISRAFANILRSGRKARDRRDVTLTHGTPHS
jgi:hypothetical protein